MASRTTTAEIMEALGELRGELRADLTAIRNDLGEVKKAQAYTNGKVANLVEDKIRRDERARVAKEGALAAVTTKEGNVVIQPPASYWTSKEKLYGALAILAGTVATVLTIVFGASK